MEQYVNYAVEQTLALLAIDSPTGYTGEAEEYVMKVFTDLGFPVTRTVKGSVLIDLGGRDADNAMLLQAHVDTLGAVVAEVKGDGRLRLSRLNGLNVHNIEGENCRIVTKFDGVYEGTFQLHNASLHVNPNYSTTTRNYDVMEVVLDEFVENAEDVKKLGIGVGDFVCFDPRPRVTEKGYIKSRFLDDKLSVGILMSFAKYLKDNNITPERRIYVHVTSYEEVGHGGAAAVPAGVTEAMAVDMGCVGDGLQCTERQVSICVKDSGGPYSYEMIKGLMLAGKKEGADFVLDVYPSYGSDVESTISAGYDIRHGLIGPGVYASHGYERSHKDGVLNTLKILKGYLL